MGVVSKSLNDSGIMADGGMEVDTTPAVRDKKRFEVKKVGYLLVRVAIRKLLYSYSITVECCSPLVLG